MKTATVRKLRTFFPELEKWIAAGETVTITKRRKIVAELIAPRPKKKPNFAKRFGLPKNYKARLGKSAVDLPSRTRIVIYGDSSFLIALYRQGDAFHAEAKQRLLAQKAGSRFSRARSG